MKKAIYFFCIVIFLSIASSVMAGSPIGMPSPMDTEQGKWLKNKIHDSTKKYGDRFNSKILKKTSKIMSNTGWDKEENERATKEYNERIRREQAEYCRSHPEKCKPTKFY